jgi:UPF0716 protein FxsA
LLILVAGLLLITPGIITDLVGFSLLIPPLRRLISGRAAGWVSQRFKMPQPHVKPQTGLDDEDVIDV